VYLLVDISIEHLVYTSLYYRPLMIIIYYDTIVMTGGLNAILSIGNKRQW